MEVKVIGAGLAGSEAALQLSKRGIKVELYEMRPVKTTGAHKTDKFAEFVCSNSLGASDCTNASGLLKKEMELLGGELIQIARKCSVPAGNALAIDRELFSQTVTERIVEDPNIEVIREEVEEIPEGNVIIASGPLTSDKLSDSIKEFTPVKKFFQKLGSAVLRLLSSTPVEDAPSGFRAFSKQAAIRLNIFDNYTYTMETLLQANAKGLKVLSVPIRVNSMLRKSKLVKNIFDYIFKSMKTTIRMFIVYRPFRFFITIAALLGLFGAGIIVRFLYFYVQGSGNGHIQSLIFAAVFLISSVQVAIIAIVGDLLSINRKLIEDVQTRMKILELDK